jgi:ADP-ribose pyrophosphatase YjhB (NUDIX family)
VRAVSTSGARPGYGTRHPQLVDLLAGLVPAAETDLAWPGGVRVRAAAYPGATARPEALVTSVRCIVRVGDRVVLCHAPDEDHVWPGGRREPGESYEQTARREVHEETGWLLEPAPPRPLGFLHFRHTEPPPPDHPYPHPDFLQVVYTSRAVRHADDADTWTDLAGWERSHELLTLADLDDAAITAVQRAFLAALPHA